MYRSLITIWPGRGLARITVATWCARSAAYSSASARGVTARPSCRSRSSSSDRIRTPTLGRSGLPGHDHGAVLRPRAAAEQVDLGRLSGALAALEDDEQAVVHVRTGNRQRPTAQRPDQVGEYRHPGLSSICRNATHPDQHAEQASGGQQHPGRRRLESRRPPRSSLARPAGADQHAGQAAGKASAPRGFPVDEGERPAPHFVVDLAPEQRRPGQERHPSAGPDQQRENDGDRQVPRDAPARPPIRRQE